jgi:hypothetical protein
MTSQSTEEIPVPDSLAETLRRAATGVPGGPPDLAEVHRRRRRGQIRRSSLGLAGVGLLVAASILTPRWLTGAAAPLESAAPAVTTEVTPPPAPAQRLFLSSAGFSVTMSGGAEYAELPERLDPSLPNFGFPPGAAGVVALGVREVTPTGEVVPVEVPGEDQRGYLALEGGGFVTLEWQSLSDVPRRDGPCITDAALYLRVYTADGTMSLSRDVRVRCETTTLVAASGTEVFLVRTPHDPQNQMPTPGRRLVAHNLADGTERTVADLDGISADVRDVNIHVDSGVGRVVAVPDSVGCPVQTLEIASGVVTTIDLAATVGACHLVDQLRVSPNGALLAFTYTTAGHEERNDVVLAVVDLDGPTLRVREVADSLPAFDPQAGPASNAVTEGTRRLAMPVTYAAGIAWNDDETVRVAWARVPAELDRLVLVDEILDLQTYVVP